ncbi:MAG: hypothetical protein AAFO03_00815 [Bacteroidota bacterium]
MEAHTTTKSTPKVGNFAVAGNLTEPLNIDFGTDQIAVDSLKIRLPLDKVSNLDSRLTSPWLLVNSYTGEIDNRGTKSNSYTVPAIGYSIRYGVERQITYDQRLKDFLTMTVPSKILHERYFEGITADNVELVYNRLQSHGLVKFSLEDFLHNSGCTDIDLKRDFVFGADFRQTVRQLEKQVKPSNRKGKGCRPFTERDNVGIEFSDRRTKSYVSSPFLKFYDKGIELLHKSDVFAKAHLSSLNFENLIRSETTIKNSKHFSRISGIKQGNQLINVLKLPQEDKQRAFNLAIQAHLMPPKRAFKSNRKLRGRELMMFELIRHSLDNGADWEQLITTMLQNFNCKVQRSRQRKFLNKLYRIYEGDKESPIWPFIDAIFSN